MDKPIGCDVVARWADDRGLSPQALAEATGMHISKVRRILAGHQDPKSEDLEAFASAIGVSVPELWQGPAQNAVAS